MLPDPNRPIEYATKADLHELRAELQHDLAALKAELTLAMANLTADVAKQLLEQHRDLTRTLIITMLGMTAMFGTLVTVLKLFA